MNFKTLVHAILLAIIPFTGAAAGIPDGYTLQYQQSFETKEASRDFIVTDPKAWKLSTSKKNDALELTRQSKYVPSYRSPFNIALLKDQVFGDFVLDVDMQSTVKAYAHQDMCVFFGFETPDRYYYTHIAVTPDPIKAESHGHDIFIVNDAERLAIATDVNDGVKWGKKVWHKIRVVRRLADGAIEVYFDDMATPIMYGTDSTFGAGYIGFGSFDDLGKIDNIKIYAPSVGTNTTRFFRPLAK